MRTLRRPVRTITGPRPSTYPWSGVLLALKLGSGPTPRFGEDYGWQTFETTQSPEAAKAAALALSVRCGKSGDNTYLILGILLDSSMVL